MKPNHNEIGVGATEDLSLRVSVATLVRVLFKNPRDGELMLALERKATLYQSENGHTVEVKSQPFGGAIRILELKMIRELIGDFHFDSERSRSEQDFRIFIRPSDWSAVREFCIQHLSRVDDPILETDPERELMEELFDALKINLKPEQYVRMPVATLVENEAAPTDNIHAQGQSTARVYRIFEASITEAFLIDTMIKNRDSFSNQELREIAFEDARSGGVGRANAILVLPLKQLTSAYLAMSPQERNAPILFGEHRLDETVTIILVGIITPKYQRM
jgi:hypothetical protein